MNTLSTPPHSQWTLTQSLATLALLFAAGCGNHTTNQSENSSSTQSGPIGDKELAWDCNPSGFNTEKYAAFNCLRSACERVGGTFDFYWDCNCGADYVSHFNEKTMRTECVADTLFEEQTARYWSWYKMGKQSQTSPAPLSKKEQAAFDTLMRQSREFSVPVFYHVLGNDFFLSKETEVESKKGSCLYSCRISLKKFSAMIGNRYLEMRHEMDFISSQKVSEQLSLYDDDDRLVGLVTSVNHDEQVIAIAPPGGMPVPFSKDHGSQFKLFVIPAGE